MKNITRTVVLMSAGFILPAAAAQAAQTQGANDRCWSEVAQYDSNSDGILDGNEFSENADTIFAALDGNKDGKLRRTEFEDCFLGQERPLPDLGFDAFDLDRDGVIVLADLTGEKIAATSAEGAQITVEQAQPTVTVNQAQPTVSVEQAQPTVTVDQAQPTVTVEQAEPTVTVSQAEPTVSVEQGQPTVTVDQAKPTVTVDQAQPTVMVKQAEPTVTVDQAQPTVMVEQAEPSVTVDQTEPTVSVEQAEAQVSIQQGISADTEKSEATFDLNRYSAEQLIGMDVETRQGNDLGEIEDVVINANNEVFLVVEVGGLLGFGETRIALPAKDIKVVDDTLVLQTTQSEADLKQFSTYEVNQYAKHSW